MTDNITCPVCNRNEVEFLKESRTDMNASSAGNVNTSASIDIGIHGTSGQGGKISKKTYRCIRCDIEFDILPESF
jgi:DNA-directed RNA polymerase subunit RPC12/RpoP